MDGSDLSFSKLISDWDAMLLRFPKLRHILRTTHQIHIKFEQMWITLDVWLLWRHDELFSGLAVLCVAKLASQMVANFGTITMTMMARSHNKRAQSVDQYKPLNYTINDLIVKKLGFNLDILMPLTSLHERNQFFGHHMHFLLAGYKVESRWRCH